MGEQTWGVYWSEKELIPFPARPLLRRHTHGPLWKPPGAQEVKHTADDFQSSPALVLKRRFSQRAEIPAPLHEKRVLQLWLRNISLATVNHSRHVQ